MDVKEGIAKLSKLFMEQQSVAEQIKEVKAEIKAGGGKPSVAAKVAKAIADCKVNALKEVSETTEQYIELSRD